MERSDPTSGRAYVRFCRMAVRSMAENGKRGEGDMSANNPERNFPVLRVADEPGTDDPAGVRKRILKQLADRLDRHHAFVKGQFIAWKPGLKNRGLPHYGEPAIVTAVLPIPVFDRSEVSAGSPYFQEPLSIVIGIHHEDDLLEFRVDGRRFEPVEG